MRASVLVLVIAACGGSSPKPAPVASAAAPPAAPAATPELPKEQPKDEPVQVAKGGDPCEGGEVTNTIGDSAGAPGGVGGGTGESTTGIGPIGTIGHGSGTGAGYGRGGSTHFGNTKGPEPTVKLGTPIVKGPLDKEIVRRIVRRHLSEVQYCYELQLQTNPDLAGTVQTQFTINGDGIVSDAAAGGFDEKVSACIAKRIKAWEFPKPKNGAVLVNYPMTLANK